MMGIQTTGADQMNPYNNNPFQTDATRDSRSERDANRALVDARNASSALPHRKVLAAQAAEATARGDERRTACFEARLARIV
jgi:hypothetical protein